MSSGRVDVPGRATAGSASGKDLGGFKHPAVAAAASLLEELRLTLDRLEYLIAKIAPSPLVAPLFPSHSIISKDDKGENIVGVALEEDEVAIIPAQQY